MNKCVSYCSYLVINYSNNKILTYYKFFQFIIHYACLTKDFEKRQYSEIN